MTPVARPVPQAVCISFTGLLEPDVMYSVNKPATNEVKSPIVMQT